MYTKVSVRFFFWTRWMRNLMNFLCVHCQEVAEPRVRRRPKHERYHDDLGLLVFEQVVKTVGHQRGHEHPRPHTTLDDAGDRLRRCQKGEGLYFFFCSFVTYSDQKKKKQFWIEEWTEKKKMCWPPRSIVVSMTWLLAYQSGVPGRAGEALHDRLEEGHASRGPERHPEGFSGQHELHRRSAAATEAADAPQAGPEAAFSFAGVSQKISSSFHFSYIFYLWYDVPGYRSCSCVIIQ